MMNQYHRAMDACAPPADLEARLQQRLLAVAPTTTTRVIRPWSFAKRAVLAAILAVMVTASVSAAVLLDWDAIFADRFGSAGAALPITETAYQKVNVTAVCGDVTLTVREALGDNKTIYMILDYQVPVTADREMLQNLLDSETDSIWPPTVGYFATDTISWKDLSAEYASRWADTDWTTPTSRNLGAEYTIFQDYRFHSGASSSVSTQGYDADTGTLTYLLRFTTNSSAQNLTEQPLTLLVLPPIIRINEEEIPLAQQPALITFQPEYTAREKTGSVQNETQNYRAEVRVSPFNISVEYYWEEYENSGKLRADTALVYHDGSIIPIRTLSVGYTGYDSTSISGKVNSGFNSQFEDILDTEQIAAVRIGSIEIPVE